MPLIWHNGLHDQIYHHSENKDTSFQMEGVSRMCLMLNTLFGIDWLKQ